MNADIFYFGMIAERIGKSSETITIDKKELNLRSFFEEKYPELVEMNYKIAINQEISDILKDQNSPCEIALLPPFAGG